MNKYFDYNDDLIPGSTARSDKIDLALESTETGFDAVENDIFRTIRLTAGSQPVEADFQVATSSAARANKTLGFDANGNPTVLSDIGSWEGDWAQSTAYLPKAIVKGPASHANSIYIALLSHTSTSDFATDLAAGKWELMIDLSTVKETIITHTIVDNADSPVALVKGQDVMVDVSAGNVTLVLPSAPVIGDQPINIMHIDGELGVDGTLTIDRNGKPIMGLAEDMTVSVPNASFGLAFSDNTRGWRVRGV